MNDIYQKIVDTLEHGTPVALATLMSRRGSSPGSLGAKMLVFGDGHTEGSIGGGCVEAEVWDAAKATLSDGLSRVLAFRLSAKDMAESGLICGGSIELLVEPLGPETLPLYRRIFELRRQGGRGLLATAVPTTDSPDRPAFKVLWLESGEITGQGADAAPVDSLAGYYKSLGPGATRAVAPEREAVADSSTPAASPAARILLESLAPQANLYIFGAGHLSMELAPIAKRVHFHVVVIDDRAFFADPERFPEADEVLALPFETAFEGLDIDENSFIVIVTRGHLHDGMVLEQAVRTPAAYIGMIGSRAKISAVYRDLESKGVRREQLDTVRAPIGLHIKARLPEEIAVSILAELILVRNERLG